MAKVMAIVEGKLMIDYAYPCMMAEKALKELHSAMLDREFDVAKEAALTALAETKLALNAITDMQAKSLR
tara:strand:- start:201 stop:410 length:210 start_codon:yes stop_codon:yes gene_type:complete